MHQSNRALRPQNEMMASEMAFRVSGSAINPLAQAGALRRIPHISQACQDESRGSVESFW
jgi:hypothetical protein